jgi:hypothetical protein
VAVVLLSNTSGALAESRAFAAIFQALVAYGESRTR